MMRINRREIAQLPKRNAKVQRRVRRNAEAIGRTAEQLAPKLTGAGAASIHAEAQLDGTWRVSWDTEHDYMLYSELGTERQPPRPFLRPAAKKYER